MFALFIYLFLLLRLLLWHMEVPKVGIKLELQLLAYATATATWDPSCNWDLYHCSQQRWILNPLNKARDGTCVLMDASQIHSLLSHGRNSLEAIHFLNLQVRRKLLLSSDRQRELGNKE